MSLDSKVTSLRGVGNAKAEAFAKVGVCTLGDLIRYCPRAYQNRGNITAVADAANSCRNTETPSPCAMILTVAAEPKVSMIRRGMTLVRFKAFDESGVCEITYFNQIFVKDVFHTGDTFRFWGRPEMRSSHLTLANPVYEPVRDGVKLDAIVPVYPLTKGLKQKFVAGAIRESLRIAASEIVDPLPPHILIEEKLCTLSFALQNIHFPDCRESLEAARRRLAFDEIFTVSLAMGLGKNISRGSAPSFADTDTSPLSALLPYELTGAQKRSVGEIVADMAKTEPMRRILCGDVGSGKTAVAALAAYVAAKNGYQCAIMAPTEILAKQHFADLAPLFEKVGFDCALLCGSMSAAEKRQTKNELKSPVGPSVIIGTHALLSDDVEFFKLGLVITDEQHRFGVNQRAALRKKSENAHTLVMSATPIPRTLSLAILGDLDVSRLDEMPPGRQKVSTFKVDESYRERLLGFIRKQKDEGHRTYVVCPAIEESEKKPADDAEEMYDLTFDAPEEEKPPMKAAVQFTEELRRRLPDMNIGFMHGKMKTAEKDAVMADFVSGVIDVLVSTTVIEVGVNVPSATLMVIENAERFGLSQLHQLRGRVGRGIAKSWCILVSDAKNETSLKRLETMCKTNDGFKIAEEDLKLRGPGDLFAKSGEFRQHGSFEAPFSRAFCDMSIFEAGSACAAGILKDDPDLSKSEHSELRKTVTRFITYSNDTIS